jgi:predicted naringenin-chalcone synthase
MTDLNEGALKAALIEIRKLSKPIKLTLATRMWVPASAVQQTADKMGITFEEAQHHIVEVAQRLMDQSKEERML